uniref:Carboxylic ester hydrolase n=1 Tax=Cupiennius salei TaxID=6928 RepID=A0AAU7E2K7_CUPSA
MYCLGLLEMHLIVLIASLFKISSSELIVETSSGPIRGTAALSDDVEAFLGIPYAEPPVGDLRFAKPVPKKRWDKILDASTLPPPCVQFSMGPYYFMPDITNMSEDCLYLNIWNPKAESNHGLRPVIIYIHPGAFCTGGTNMKVYDGSRLASLGDVVVVTINYRLGVLGYFLAYNEVANGNMGMYDQITAMKWIKSNAKNFGGDPENIVLMGISAGAFSAAAHVISPLSNNLFRRAILQSGGMVHPYFMDDNARLYRNSELMSSVVGCANETVSLKSDPRAVVKCLKEKPKEILANAELLLMKSNPINFYPRVNDEFLPKSSVAFLREGKFRKDINVIIGVNKDEGGLFLTTGLPDYFGLYGKVSLNVINKYRAALISRGFSMVAGEPRPSELVDFYIKNVKNRTSTGYTKMVSNFIGDYMIACNTIFFADFLSLKGNVVYFYKFEYRSTSTPIAEWMGTTHLDDVPYVFGNPFHENFTAEEEELSNRLIARWSAFAKTGNPNIPGHVPWLRYSYHNPLFLSFGQEEESIRLKPIDRCEVWRERFGAAFDADSIRRLRNSAMNITFP